MTDLFICKLRLTHPALSCQ